MLFNTPTFVLFLAGVYVLYRTLPHRTQNVLLLVASYVFYGWFEWRFLALILLSTAVDYGCALALDDPRRKGRRGWLLASLVTNLGILGVFKYLGFFSREAAELAAALGLPGELPVLDIALPIGLSFYTLQSMAYTIDVYRGRVRACRDPVVFGLFIAFFPQLVAGPIERSERLIPQLARPHKPSRAQMVEGAHLILWGYYKKLFVADNLAVIVPDIYEAAETPSGFLVLIGTYAFAWQIYCDFSGYTDIARGLAKWMGIDLVENFRLPYFASSPRELWKRWHISLSEWLRDYLYIPLGGSRRGRPRSLFNLMVTMGLGGLWHGANWTFVGWGLFHGAGLALQRAVGPFRLTRWTRPLAILVTFHFTCMAYLIFRSHDIQQVFTLAAALVTDFAPHAGDVGNLPRVAAPLLLLFAVQIVQYCRGEDHELPRGWPRLLQGLLVVVMVASIVLFGSSYGLRFIYFQF